MKVFKAFATHSRFVDNAANNAINAFGELSTHSRSYEKDIKIYPHSSDKNVVLNLYRTTNNDKLYTPSNNEVTTMLDVSKWVYDYTLNANGEIYTDELLREVLTEFQDKLHSFKTSKVVDDGTFYCIEYLSFKDTSDNEYIIWFSDACFQLYYEDYEIDVVPPIESLDIFFTTPERINEELAKYPIDVLTRMANGKKEKCPETVFRSDTFYWYNPKTGKPEIPTVWFTLIWGDAGDNIDSIRDALVDFILDNSDHTEDEWKEIFPDIFKRSEFLIIPQWNVYSNENKVKEQASLYSPFANYNTAYTKYIKPYLDAKVYTEAHAKQYMQIMGLYYRSICAYTVSSPENKDNKFRIQDLYPDFINVPSTSTDFNYMSEDTIEFTLALQEMLAYAETSNEYSVLPRDQYGAKKFSKVKRNGKVYLVYKRGYYNYLVLYKSSMVPPTTP